MNKPKAQGTAWESEFVRLAQSSGLLADRMPEGGMNDAGDVWITDTPSKTISPYLHYHDVPVVAWSRLVKGSGARRVADGARSVVVIDTIDFLKLAEIAASHYVAFVVECKATERLNVTRELENAKRKLTNWKARH